MHDARRAALGCRSFEQPFGVKAQSFIMMSAVKFLAELLIAFLCVYFSFTDDSCKLKDVYRQNEELIEIPAITITAECVGSIILSHNNISTVGPNAFSNYEELVKLAMDHNNLISIDDTAFKETEIRELDLSHNNLVSIPNLCNIKHILEVLNLTNNKIAVINEDELSKLDKLISLFLNVNRLDIIAENIFPKHLTHLTMRNNNIIDFQQKTDELRAIKFLQLSSNALQRWPNLEEVGINSAATRALIRGTNISESDIKACGIEHLDLSFGVFKRAPHITCPKPDDQRLHTLSLAKSNLDDSTDLSNLESMSATLRKLNLTKNAFNNFPQLPSELRKTLWTLRLTDCNISMISKDYLNDFDLKNLDLSRNPLVTLPSKLFLTAKELNLTGITGLAWDPAAWGKHFCYAMNGNLEVLDLSGTMQSLTWLPELPELNAWCNQQTTRSLILNHIRIPNDCSIAWMKPLTCTSIATELRTVSPTCKAEVLIGYDEPHFRGNGLSIYDNGEGVLNYISNNEFASVAVRGRKSWYGFSGTSLAITLSPGNYPELGAAHSGIPLTWMPETSCNYEPLSPTHVDVVIHEDLCEKRVHNDEADVLNDGNLNTCLSVHRVMMFKILVPNMPPFQPGSTYVQVHTRDMPCDLQFHVLVLIPRRRQLCTSGAINNNGYDSTVKCSLEHVEDKERTICLFRCSCEAYDECVYDGSYYIRLAHFNRGEVCDVKVIVPPNANEP